MYLLRRQVRWLSSKPWFVEQESAPPKPHAAIILRAAPVPEEAPSVLKELHSVLMQSPHLEPSRLVVTRSLSPEFGPPLARKAPHGKRKKGGTYAGESAFDIPGSLWNWTVLAEVKEGTEKKGAIQSVVRLIRKSLLAVQPPLALAPNSKKRMENGWAMVDGGEFAVHVLSKGVRERYFDE